MEHMDRYITIKQACELAQVCRNTMKRFIREGHVSAERLPSPAGRGHWRIVEGSVISLLSGTIREQALDHLRRLRA